MKTTWGFDLGTASIGFAVVEQDESGTDGRILKLGVRIFSEGVNGKEQEAA